MEIKPRKSKTLYKYLFSYAIILIIPLILFTYLINTSILHSLENQTLDAVKGNLERVKEQTEQKFYEMERIAVGISENHRLSPYIIKKNYYKTYEGISELKSYMFGNDFIYDVIYYIRNDDGIYAASQCADIRFFFDYIYRFEKWDFDTLYSDFNSIDAPTIRPSEMLNCSSGGREVITYIYPIKPYEPYASVVFLIDNGKMKALLRSILKESDENVIILDDKGEIITVLKDEQLLMDIKDRYSLEEMNSETSGYISISDDDYFITRMKSDNGRMTFISIVRKDNIMEIVNSIKRQVYIVILTALLLGFLVITAAIYINYTPLHRLQKKIAAILEAGNKEYPAAGQRFLNWGKDEMLAVNMAFDSVISMNEKLNQDAEKYKHKLREFVLKELVKGGYSAKKGILYDDIISIKNKFFKVIVFRFLKQETKHDDILFSKWVRENVRRIFSGGLELYSIDNLEENQFIAVLCFDEKNRLSESPNTLDRLLEEVYASISMKYNVRMAIGVGNDYKDVLSIGHSFAEAVKALRYSLIDSDYGIFHFDEIAKDRKFVHDKDIYTYLYDDLKKLPSQIKSGNLQSIEKTLKRLFGTLVKKDVPEFISRCIAFDIFNMLIKISIEKKIDLDSIMDNDSIPFLFRKEDSLDRLFDTLYIVCRKLCSHLPELQFSENPLMKQVMAYIKSHFTDYSFTVETMAADLNTSSSYLSQIFKESMGYTLTEYIWKLRIKIVKKMLESSELPIRDIVRSVGYIDISSFNRKFKSEEGITLGEYRKKCKYKVQAT